MEVLTKKKFRWPSFFREGIWMVHKIWISETLFGPSVNEKLINSRAFFKILFCVFEFSGKKEAYVHKSRLIKAVFAWVNWFIWNEFEWFRFFTVNVSKDQAFDFFHCSNESESKSIVQWLVFFFLIIKTFLVRWKIWHPTPSSQAVFKLYGYTS